MDTKEYIKSGILESYVLGLVSDQERREVQCLSHIYEEIGEELKRVEISLEKFAEMNAVSPPVELKSRIMDQIRHTEQDDKDEVENAKSPVERGGRIVPMYWKVSVAASLVLLFGLGFLFLNEKKKNTEFSNQIAYIESQSASEIQQKADSLMAARNREVLIASAGTKQIVLAGTPVSPKANANVYYNKERNEFFLTYDQMPAPSQGQQYQLWAIADGQPIDLGVIDKSGKLTNTRKLTIEQVDAFAITLEKEGGSPTPNLEQLFVIGNV